MGDLTDRSSAGQLTVLGERGRKQTTGHFKMGIWQCHKPDCTGPYHFPSFS